MPPYYMQFVQFSKNVIEICDRWVGIFGSFYKVIVLRLFANHPRFLAGIIQASMALIIVSTTRHLKMGHAILTAVVGGFGMACGLLIVNLILGGGIDIQFALQTINYSVKTGFGLTFLIVLGLIILVKGFRFIRRQFA